MIEAVNEGGGYVVPLADAEGVVWGNARDADGLARALDQAPKARWVQLPFAGIENFVHLVDDAHVWACGKGVYAEPVAELALTLGLAGWRGLSTYSRAQSWEAPQGRNLLGARVTILGGGGIATSLIRLLQPFGCHITVVRRRAEEELFHEPVRGVRLDHLVPRFPDASPHRVLPLIVERVPAGAGARTGATGNRDSRDRP